MPEPLIVDGTVWVRDDNYGEPAPDRDFFPLLAEEEFG